MQTSRIGDLAQTLPLVTALRNRYREAEIILACREGVHTLLAEAVVPAEVLPLSPGFLATLGGLTGAVLPPAASCLAAVPRLLAPFSMVINVTHDYESAVLASAVSAERRVGRLHAPDGEIRAAGTVARYVWAMVRHRTENLFHLSDLHLLMAELRPQACSAPMRLADDAGDRADRRLRAEGWDGVRPVIGLQLGASDFHRAWDPEGFAGAAARIAAAQPVDFVLFGDVREREFSGRFRAAFTEGNAGRVFDLTGRTRLGEMPALLGRCALVIGNDTGTLHVAAAAGVRTLGIYFATAFFTETAPYGAGHAVLQTELACSPCSASSRCPVQLCRGALTAETVAQAALWLLDPSRAVPRLPEALHLYRSEFADNGTLLYVPAEPSASSAYRKALTARCAWSAVLGIAPSRRETELLRASGDASDRHDPGGAVAAWAEEGAEAAQEMLDLLRICNPDPLRVAVLRRRLEEIPALLTETAHGMLRDYCRMAFMDFEDAGAEGILEQIARRFREIREVSQTLAGFPSPVD